MSNVYATGYGAPSEVLSATAATNTTTTSATPVALNAMSLTPTAGTYMVFFSSYTVQSAYDHTFIQLYVNGVAVDHTLRESTGREAATLSTNPIFNPTMFVASINVNGGQAVEVRWWTSGATATCHQRGLFLLRTGG